MHPPLKAVLPQHQAAAANSPLLHACTCSSCSCLPSWPGPAPCPRRFTVHGRFQHDITLDVYAQECVVSSGSGQSLAMDMHRGGVVNNLWTNLDLGLGSRPFESGGGTSRGAHAGGLEGQAGWGRRQALPGAEAGFGGRGLVNGGGSSARGPLRTLLEAPEPLAA